MMDSAANPAYGPDALRKQLAGLPKPVLWALAARLKTIGLSVTPVLAGSILAAQQGRFSAAITLAAILSAACIQIGTNLWNDAADAQRGIDTQERLGPARMTALGLLPAGAVQRGALMAFFAAAVAGLYLVQAGGWPILAIGVVSLALGYFYSMGPYPLSGTPLGEVLVIVFFGVAAVTGTAFLHGAAPDARLIMTGFLTGLPAAAVLLVNNHRDRVGDEQGGRRTLAIVIGGRGAKWLFALLVCGAFGGYLLVLPAGLIGGVALIPAGLSAALLIHGIFKTPVSRALNGLIARTALYQLLLVASLLSLFVAR